MSILSECKSIMESLSLPVESGSYHGNAPQQYTVLIPLSDTFSLYSDNKPNCNIEEVRISLYSKTNYLTLKNRILKALLAMDFTITNKCYVEYEAESGYHHYVIDVQKHYEWEE